jgi:hypothetical protein
LTIGSYDFVEGKPISSSIIASASIAFLNAILPGNTSYGCSKGSWIDIDSHNILGAKLLFTFTMPFGQTLVVSPGGTRTYLDTKKESRRRITTQIFEKAKPIIVQSEEMTQEILGCCTGREIKTD